MQPSVYLFAFLAATAQCATQTIDAVVLDELLREIVDSSMSDLRHRLQEAVFATAFRRRIQQSVTSSSSASSEPKFIDKLLDDYIQPQKLSLALETFTTTSKPKSKVQLITADDVTSPDDNSFHSVLFDDAISISEPVFSLPRVPIWVAVSVVLACVLTFFLLIGTIVYYVSFRRSKRRRDFGVNMMPDPFTVQGLATSSCHLDMPVSRRSSVLLEQDRAASTIWALP